jgi:Ca2+-binding RTX toxin-like protein
MITSGVIFTGTNALSNADQKLNFTGGAAQDSVTGGAGNDTLAGGDGNDTLIGAAGSNSLSGGNGDDTITSGSLTDTVDGGAGNDTVSVLTSTATGTFGGGAGVADVLRVVDASDLKGATLSGFETLQMRHTSNAAISAVFTVPQLAAFTDLTSFETTGNAALTATNLTLTIDATTTANLGSGAITLDADIAKYTVAASAVGGITFTSPTTGTYSVTGGDGADVIDLSASTAAVNQTLIGGAGNDTIKVSSANFDASDTVQGGTGSGDTLQIVGNDALTVTLPTGDTGFEAISITGRTSGAISITTRDENIGATDTLVVTTSSTTGGLTFNASAEDGSGTKTGKLNATGGTGDDSLTGTGNADTLSGGTGSDTLIGGAGNDTITSGTGNNNVTGGAGSDTINLTDGGADVVVIAAGDARTLVAAIHSDTITGFQVATDKINISIDDLDAEGTAALTLSDTGGGDVSAARSFASSLEVATNTNIGSVGLGARDLIKFTSTTATSFASAIGTAVITLNHATNHAVAVDAGATEATLAVWYNATTSQAVVGLLYNAVGGDDVAVFKANDTFQTVALVGMSAADYANFTFTNFNFVA